MALRGYRESGKDRLVFYHQASYFPARLRLEMREDVQIERSKDNIKEHLSDLLLVGNDGLPSIPAKRLPKTEWRTLGNGAAHRC